jgi:hypothetical protein
MNLSIIQNKIYEIRGQKVMLDFDLAELYEVETRVLKQSVRRNINRFPDDFMFILNEKEIENLVSQNVIPSKGRFGGALPFAFTEQGVAMLSGILSSEKAIEMNIAIMRTFVLIRQLSVEFKELSEKLKEIESKYDKNFKDIYEAIGYLLEKDQLDDSQKKRARIGFKKDKE